MSFHPCPFELLSVHPYLCMSVHPYLCMSVYPYLCTYVCPTKFLTVCPSIRPSDCLAVHLCISFIKPYRYLTCCTLNNGSTSDSVSVHPSIWLSIRPPVRMTVCPSNRTSDSRSLLPFTRLSTRSSVCLSVYLSVWRYVHWITEGSYETGCMAYLPSV